MMDIEIVSPKHRIEPFASTVVSFFQHICLTWDDPVDYFFGGEEVKGIKKSRNLATTHLEKFGLNILQRELLLPG